MAASKVLLMHTYVH